MESNLAALFLIEGRSRISEVIKIDSRGCWSHTAVYLGRKDDIQNDPIDREITDHIAFQKTSGVLLETNIKNGTVLRAPAVYRDDI